jgi:hypothetical protein
VGVGDHCPVYPDVVVVIEIEELLSSEQGVVVSDDRVRDTKAVHNVLDKGHWLFGANFRQGPSLDPFSEFVDRVE